MNIAIIPARKGSKRLKNKNKKKLLGIPLVEYTFKFAFANKFDKVIVSSDDLDIQKIADKYCFSKHRRNSELSTDNSLIIDLLSNIIQEYSIDKNDKIYLLQPTNPIRDNELFKEIIYLNKKGKYDTIISLSKINKKTGEISGDFFYPNYQPGSRSQDLANKYYENGDIYMFSSKNILEGNLFGKKIGYLITGEKIPNIDIDDQKDFDMCRIILKRFKHKLNYLS